MDHASNSSDAAPRPTVLVVDDSNTMRRSLEMTLDMAGWHVTTAPDGAQALDFIARGLRPDLVLTDIVMPGIDGLAVIRTARQALRFTPILALTTQSQAALRDEGKAAGATAWLLKPTGGAELLAIVNRFRPPSAPVPRARAQLSKTS
jgi:two-component system, chemotaxis family, chemotaxis protein CheY